MINLPKHIAIIMDGNGRWAQNRSLPRIKGHQKGAKVVKEIVTYCREIGIKALTLYAFSEENWGRPEDEVKGLMELLAQFMVTERETLLKNQVHFHPIGEIDKLPTFVKQPLYSLMKETEKGAKMVLNIALSYSGKVEIVNGVNRIIKDGLKEVDSDTLSNYLWTSNFGGDVDLMIRTGGEYRISNFLLWQLAYAELFFDQIYWPDFTKERLSEILDKYSKRDRRFGKVKM